MSDREEARALVQSVITEIAKLPSLTAAEMKDLEKARAVLRGW
jgi:hypothetical protein